ncbi:NfeD family protein [Rivihabitans pingtungensis]|uniref:Membrane protein implicated in regulation of membrane protease activity n=1 Tax=Rivihabitans pingtungensis TaxID=1054498 RepID=A0A318LJL0_9NEIS|nr:hypothetical protein [Rivihabitans pingtungensis]PXX81907.1 membrane protein implicated in regulation of membrane protease activity [Rivihabitans pingtungensis]
MLISSSIFWWLAALLVAMLEVSSGSFYLLAVALGLGSVGLGLFLGLGLPLALSAGSMVMALAVLAVARWRQRRILPSMVDDDTGQEVQLTWLAADNPHQGRVRYRGCEWDAELDYTGAPPLPGVHGCITGRHANLLRVHFAPPSEHQEK